MMTGWNPKMSDVDNAITVWTGDRNPINETNLKAVENVWISLGAYKAREKAGTCYVLWGDKAILSFVPQEKEDGSWEVLMRQNPKMGRFPDQVMDRYRKGLAEVISTLTQEPEPSPQP